MKCFSLSGVKAISYIAANTLPDTILQQAVSKQPIVIYSSRTPVPFYGTPECSVEQINENNGTKEVASLVFRSLVVIPEAFAIAFLITDTNGQTYMLGCKNSPYPSITAIQQFGAPEGEPHCLNVTVEHTAIKALFPVTIA